MFRVALTKLVILSLVVALPATGSGTCPCRFVKLFTSTQSRHASNQTALLLRPEKKQCCSHHQHTHDDHDSDNRQKPKPPTKAPHDPPCNHGPAFDVTPSSGNESRPESEGLEHSTTAGLGWPGWSCFTGTSMVPLGQRTRAHPPHENQFRYSHAFRC